MLTNLAGCHLNPHCPDATDVCRTETPRLEEVQPGHFVSCHRARELSLRGIAR